MSYKKTLLILANSKKFSGRCVAGIDVSGGKLGRWIRPVSSRSSEELSIDERRYESGEDVKLLDLATITFREARPHDCQVENHVIDDGKYWVLEGRERKLGKLREAAIIDGPLWIDGYHSYSGRNDRIPVDAANKLDSSLLLVLAESPTFKTAKGKTKRQVRVDFALGSKRYNLTVTDPKKELALLAKPDGDYPHKGDILMCVSLGEPFDGYRYKLAAGVIEI